MSGQKKRPTGDFGCAMPTALNKTLAQEPHVSIMSFLLFSCSLVLISLVLLFLATMLPNRSVSSIDRLNKNVINLSSLKVVSEGNTARLGRFPQITFHAHQESIFELGHAGGNN
jgi:hypothetical protein